MSGKWRLRCGAYARSTGKPCQRKVVPGKKRCPNHGGLSTGPKTKEGKRRSMMNLPRVRAAAERKTKEGGGSAAGARPDEAVALFPFDDRFVK